LQRRFRLPSIYLPSRGGGSFGIIYILLSSHKRTWTGVVDDDGDDDDNNNYDIVSLIIIVSSQNILLLLLYYVCSVKSRSTERMAIIREVIVDDLYHNIMRLLRTTGIPTCYNGSVSIFDRGEQPARLIHISDFCGRVSAYTIILRYDVYRYRLIVAITTR